LNNGRVIVHQFSTIHCASAHFPFRRFERNMHSEAATDAAKTERSKTMLDQIKGLHHVTSMARDARENNEFFTNKLGLRRVKKTVNFDAPDVYHLYYADEFGTPGSVMTYFPFPNAARGRPGTGEVGVTAFSVPDGTLGFWEQRLAEQGASAKSV
jgi:hypothetical protein